MRREFERTTSSTRYQELTQSTASDLENNENGNHLSRRRRKPIACMSNAGPYDMAFQEKQSIEVRLRAIYLRCNPNIACYVYTERSTDRRKTKHVQ
jgi:hypothetical protein